MHSNASNRRRATEMPETQESTLLPMLIAGLALMVVGAVVIMAFV